MSKKASAAKTAPPPGPNDPIPWSFIPHKTTPITTEKPAEKVGSASASASGVGKGKAEPSAAVVPAQIPAADLHTLPVFSEELAQKMVASAASAVAGAPGKAQSAPSDAVSSAESREHVPLPYSLGAQCAGWVRLPTLFQAANDGASFEMVKPCAAANEEEKEVSGVRPYGGVCVPVFSAYARALHHVFNALACVRGAVPTLPTEKSNFLYENLYPKAAAPKGAPASASGFACVSPSGKYVARVYYHGKWRLLPFDDYIPVDANGQSLLPLSNTPGEAWPTLLSKAVLKLLNGRELDDAGVWAFYHLSAVLPERISVESVSALIQQHAELTHTNANGGVPVSVGGLLDGALGVYACQAPHSNGDSFTQEIEARDAGQERMYLISVPPPPPSAAAVAAGADKGKKAPAGKGTPTAKDAPAPVVAVPTPEAPRPTLLVTDLGTRTSPALQSFKADALSQAWLLRPVSFFKHTPTLSDIVTTPSVRPVSVAHIAASSAQKELRLLVEVVDDNANESSLGGACQLCVYQQEWLHNTRDLVVESSFSGVKLLRLQLASDTKADDAAHTHTDTATNAWRWYRIETNALRGVCVSVFSGESEIFLESQQHTSVESSVSNAIGLKSFTGAGRYVHTHTPGATPAHTPQATLFKYNVSIGAPAAAQTSAGKAPKAAAPTPTPTSTTETARVSTHVFVGDEQSEQHVCVTWTRADGELVQVLPSLDGAPLEVPQGTYTLTGWWSGTEAAAGEVVWSVRLLSDKAVTVEETKLDQLAVHTAQYTRNYNRLLFREQIGTEAKTPITLSATIGVSAPNTGLSCFLYEEASLAAATVTNLFSVHQAAKPVYSASGFGSVYVPHVTVSKERRYVLECFLSNEPSDTLSFVLRTQSNGPVSLASDNTQNAIYELVKGEWEKQAPGRKNNAAASRTKFLEKVKNNTVPLKLPLEVDIPEAAIRLVQQSEADAVKALRDKELKKAELHANSLVAKREQETVFSTQELKNATTHVTEEAAQIAEECARLLPQREGVRGTTLQEEKQLQKLRSAIFSANPRESTIVTQAIAEALNDYTAYATVAHTSTNGVSEELKGLSVRALHMYDDVLVQEIKEALRIGADDKTLLDIVQKIRVSAHACPSARMWADAALRAVRASVQTQLQSVNEADAEAKTALQARLTVLNEAIGEKEEAYVPVQAEPVSVDAPVIAQ